MRMFLLTLDNAVRAPLTVRISSESVAFKSWAKMSLIFGVFSFESLQKFGNSLIESRRIWNLSSKRWDSSEIHPSKKFQQLSPSHLRPRKDPAADRVQFPSILESLAKTSRSIERRVASPCRLHVRRPKFSDIHVDAEEKQKHEKIGENISSLRLGKLQGFQAVEKRSLISENNQSCGN